MRSEDNWAKKESCNKKEIIKVDKHTTLVIEQMLSDHKKLS